MTNAEMLDRYNELYEAMAGSGDPKKMKIFGEAEKWAFSQFVNMNPRAGAIWLQKLEPVDWNNYLSEEEALDIVEKFESQDGKKGPMWTASQIDNAVRNFGGDREIMPYFNPWALYVAMNMIVSDHAKTLRELVPDEDLPKVVYKLAVEKLEDPDRPEFIRSYFSV